MYILWIDLATFFPRIDRRVSDMADILIGLPPEVQQLTRREFERCTCAPSNVDEVHDSKQGQEEHRS